jgi:hypothetical protein
VRPGGDGLQEVVGCFGYNLYVCVALALEGERIERDVRQWKSGVLDLDLSIQI